MTGTFEGVGSLQFTPDNKFAYAYQSLSIADSGSETVTYFNFITGSEYLVGKLIGGRNMKSSGEITVEITFNDVTVFKTKSDNGVTATYNAPFSAEVPIIIPPFTNVKIIVSSDQQDEVSIGLNCKVNGAIEQENLESITDNNKWASK